MTGVSDLDRSGLAVVTGGGGFIGGHLVAELQRRGFGRIRAVDIKPVERWYQQHDGVENVVADLRDADACGGAAAGASYVFNLASDMGGMGFIETHKADCMLSVLINTHMLVASRDAGVERYLYASSACVYAADKQTDTDVTALKESDAYPAMPEDGYGWEKLFSERMCRHFMEDYGISVRVPRFHNVYGAYGTYDGGREKAPAAICRKVAQAQLDGTNAIEIWGDGQQTRSFTYIDDTIEGIFRLMESDVARADQPRLVAAGDDQRARRHRRGHRRRQARAELQARRTAGSPRPQQRQHADPRAARLGAVDDAGDRARDDVRVGLRADDERGQGRGCARISGRVTA